MLDEYDGIVYVIDLETYSLMYMNRSGCKMLGIVREEVLGKKCYEAIQGFDARCPFCNDVCLEENGFSEWEYFNEKLGKSFLMKDRKFVWDGKPARIEFATDVSGYREKIKNSENRRQSVLKSLPGGIARIDARDGKTVLWYGASFLSHIGYTGEQFENELNNQYRYIHPDDREKVETTMEKARQTKEISMTEVRIVQRSGAVRTINMSFSFEEGRMSEDGIPSFYSVGIDISEFRAQQELQKLALEEAFNAARAANTAKANFLSSVSHDIRTPMNAILGMSAIARSSINDPVKVMDCLDKISISGNHLLNLINEVLDMSKIESGRMDIKEMTFDLPDLVQNVLDICRPLAEEKNQTLDVDASRVVHEKVSGDAGRLQQVFMNLLSNAIKYTPAGGKIGFTIVEKSLAVSAGALYEFIFTDNGIGMSREFIEHVFEPFSRAQDTRINQIQGTGLGLTISENIVHLMNGSIEVESELNAGSRFTVSVPLKLQNENEPYLKELSGLRVLVVDENRDIGAGTRLLLKEMGMTGDWETSGQEAIDRIVSAHESGEDYFAVILDWKLPEMNGIDVTKAIRSELKDKAPFIILSAYNCADIGKECYRAGVTSCISKPFFKSRLFQVFSRYVKVSAEMENEPEPVGEIDLSKVRILLVEDNLLNSEIARELLKMKGAFVDTAFDGKDAVDLFSRSPENYYSVVLMDIQMPVMNGYEACVAIRKLDRNDAKKVAIIALTANAFTEDIALAKKSGMNDHISKPIDVEKLYTVVHKWSPENSLSRQDLKV